MQELSQNKSSCMTISSTTFNSIYDTCKAMKLDYYIVKINLTNIEIWGTDSTFSYIGYNKFESINTAKYELQFVTSRIAISDLTLLLSTPSEYMTVYDQYITNDAKNDFLMINSSVIGYRDCAEAFRVRDLLYGISYNRLPNWSYLTINDDESIQKMMSCKVSDNIIPYVKDGHYMTIYKGIVPMCKSDKLSLVIFDLENNRFLSVFTLTKKKRNYSYFFVFKNII